MRSKCLDILCKIHCEYLVRLPRGSLLNCKVENYINNRFEEEK